MNFRTILDKKFTPDAIPSQPYVSSGTANITDEGTRLTPDFFEPKKSERSKSQAITEKHKTKYPGCDSNA